MWYQNFVSDKIFTNVTVLASKQIKVTFENRNWIKLVVHYFIFLIRTKREISRLYKKQNSFLNIWGFIQYFYVLKIFISVKFSTFKQIEIAEDEFLYYTIEIGIKSNY